MPKTVIVDPEKCIGCSTCALVDPETFYMDQADFKAKVKKQPISINDTVNSAIDSCPVGAISISDEKN